MRYLCLDAQNVRNLSQGVEFFELFLYLLQDLLLVLTYIHDREQRNTILFGVNLTRC
jgi:hypothetical protein